MGIDLPHGPGRRSLFFARGSLRLNFVLTLKLDTREANDLLIALEEHLHGLRVELASADSREFRDQLRGRLDRLEAIAERLRPGTAAPAQAP